MIISALQQTTEPSTIPSFTPAAAPAKSNFSDVFEDRLTDWDLPKFERSLTGDLGHDQQLLRSALSAQPDANRTRDLIDAFLKAPSASPASELSDMLHQMRTGFHPLQEKLDRLETARAELGTALKGYTAEDDINAGKQILRELDAQIDIVKRRIAEDIENSFLEEIGAVIGAQPSAQQPHLPQAGF